MAGGLRQVPAGELLANDHGERFGDRHLFGRRAVVVALAAAALLQRGIEVRCDARQPACAQCLDPCLLDRVVDRTSRLAARLLAHVGTLVVIAQPQRQRVSRAPHQLHVERVKIARGERQLNLIARDLRLIRAERDLKLLAPVARNGPQRRADGALEGLDGGFFLGHAACSGSGGRLQRRRRFGQFHAETALEVLGDDRPLHFVALVHEGGAEGVAHVAEDLGVLGPVDDRAR